MRHREGLLLRAQNDAKSEKFLGNIVQRSWFNRRGRGGLSTQNTEENVMPNQGGTREQHVKAGEKSHKGSTEKQAAGKSTDKTASASKESRSGAKSSDTRKSH
jgi:hypothetical protein